MPSLSASFNVGTGSVSSLVKSAATLQNELATYEDDAQKIAFENSGYTDTAFATYQSYLNSRISTLSTSGTIEDQIKAQNMQQEVVTATHSNISFHIQQDNINLMSSGISGTAAGYYQKMQVLQGQYQTAVNIGDTTLADTLMSQYYSASQSYQTALQTASDSAATLASTNATDEKEVVTNLDNALKIITDGMATGGNVQSTITSWVKANAKTLGTLGVVLPQGAAPNYWNIVNGVLGAKYNAYNLLSNMYSTSDPQQSITMQQNATMLFNGETKIPTAAGNLTAQQVAQAEVTPNMFILNESTGKYQMTQKIGLQFAGKGQGQFAGEVENTYSGDATKTIFLSPSQTNMMTKMGLEFSETNSKPKTAEANAVQSALGEKPNSNATGSEVANNGVTATVTNKSPLWLQKAMGVGTGTQTSSAEVNLYLDTQVPGGGLMYGQVGSKEYNIVMSDSKGLTGGFKVTQNADGTMNIESMGGQYGFDQTNVYNTINNALNTQIQISGANDEKSSVKPLNLPPLPKLQTTASPAATINSTSTPGAPSVTPIQAPKATIQGSNVNPQQTKGNLQGSGSASLNNSGGGGNSSIKL